METVLRDFWAVLERLQVGHLWAEVEGEGRWWEFLGSIVHVQRQAMAGLTCWSLRAKSAFFIRPALQDWWIKRPCASCHNQPPEAPYCMGKGSHVKNSGRDVIWQQVKQT
ncbi:MAG: hypothetical protein CMP47_14615 [Rickettsiales bacterium]|nr:hypothetical protein [Rickettsiales bacterium]